MNEKAFIIERLIKMDKYRIDQSKGLEFGLYTLGDHLPGSTYGRAYLCRATDS